MKKNTVVETNEGPWIAASGLVFVAAWVVGFIIAFSAPAATASTAVWTAYYLSHSGVSMFQTYLIDGLTGAALIVFAAALELDQETDTFKLLPLGLLVGATSILALRSGALPQWLNRSGAVLALLLIIAGWSFPLNSAALTIVLDVSLVGLLLWVASVSVVIVGEAES